MRCTAVVAVSFFQWLSCTVPTAHIVNIIKGVVLFSLLKQNKKKDEKFKIEINCIGTGELSSHNANSTIQWHQWCLLFWIVINLKCKQNTRTWCLARLKVKLICLYWIWKWNHINSKRLHLHQTSSMVCFGW